MRMLCCIAFNLGVWEGVSPLWCLSQGCDDGMDSGLGVTRVLISCPDLNYSGTTCKDRCYQTLLLQNTDTETRTGFESYSVSYLTYDLGQPLNQSKPCTKEGRRGSGHWDSHSFSMIKSVTFLLLLFFVYVKKVTLIAFSWASDWESKRQSWSRTPSTQIVCLICPMANDCSCFLQCLL